MDEFLSAQAEWELKFCGYRTYRTPEEAGNESLYCPYFCPVSILATNCILGKLQTLISEEKPCCCEMGWKGWACCATSVFPAFLGPYGIGAYFYFIFLAAAYRRNMIDVYGIKEEEVPRWWCVCKKIYFSCHYPCSFFQMYATLREFQRIKRPKKSESEPSAQIPEATAIAVAKEPTTNSSDSNEKSSASASASPTTNPLNRNAPAVSLTGKNMGSRI